MNHPQMLTGFTVYQTFGFVTIRSGFSDIPGWHVICSCRSYEQAVEAAQSASRSRQQPFKTSI
ncbi:hypothetical protein [Leptolyngbya ohadii]|uniref:hypothetical protein n=1 Tax=Leptolyngbya ohadii TaxID=1962290 RepID=UPI00117ADE02|nr:hypothetical protein [Leptolyngbya ohadii]